MTDTQSRAVAAARRHRERHGAAILREFAGLLALPNVSRDHADVAANAAAIAGALADRGAEVDLVTRPGAGPLIVGRLGPPGRAVAGLYAHYDGQPVDPGEWSHPPFTPTLCSGVLGGGGVPVPMPEDGGPIDPEWRIYARSAADDKAPIMALLAALDGLAAAGIDLPAPVVFALDGEEEIGSPTLDAHFADVADRLAADVWLVCDGPVHRSGRPQIVFGARGIAEMELTVYGPVRPLHSGHYGNWAPNPAHVLVSLLASM